MTDENENFCFAAGVARVVSLVRTWAAFSDAQSMRHGYFAYYQNMDPWPWEKRVQVLHDLRGFKAEVSDPIDHECSLFYTKWCATEEEAFADLESAIKDKLVSEVEASLTPRFPLPEPGDEWERERYCERIDWNGACAMPEDKCQR